MAIKWLSGFCYFSSDAAVPIREQASILVLLFHSVGQLCYHDEFKRKTLHTNRRSWRWQEWQISCLHAEVANLASFKSQSLLVTCDWNCCLVPVHPHTALSHPQAQAGRHFGLVSLGWCWWVRQPRSTAREKRITNIALNYCARTSIYLACIFNTLVTPSRNKPLHVWVGRIGLPLGIWGFGWGAWLSWGRPGVDLSFSIPITIGGLMQVISEVVGYYAIRNYKAVSAEIESLSSETAPGKVAMLKVKQKTYLMTHIGCMIGLFVMACSIPAIIRLTDFGGLPALLLAIGGLSVINHFYNESFINEIRSKSAARGASETVQELSPLVH